MGQAARLHPAARHDPAVIALLADERDRLQITHWIADATYEVLLASDGYTASAMISARSVAAIVTDRVLPPWPGLPAFPHLRREHPQLAIVYVGALDRDSVAAARAAGATHVLRRPLRRDSVLGALATRTARE